MFKGWYRFTVLGADQVPAEGSVVIAANHLGSLDAAALTAASPRPVRTLAPDELFEPPLDRMSNAAGHISMNPEGPDFVAMAFAAEVLREHEVVATFPEGVRGTGRVASIRHEAAYLALRAGAVVVPAAILGTRRTGMAIDALPPRNSRIAVVFGEAFRLTSQGDVYRRCVVAAAGETMRQRLADHAHRAQEITGLRLPDDSPAGPATSGRTHDDVG
jgi:1-acyl-sn-glycerol-3-phosphate acyltransferase